MSETMKYRWTLGMSESLVIAWRLVSSKKRIFNSGLLPDHCQHSDRQGEATLGRRLVPVGMLRRHTDSVGDDTVGRRLNFALFRLIGIQAFSAREHFSTEV